MPVRGKSMTQKQKDTIRATQLMNRLERFTSARPGDHDYEKAQLTPSHIQAIQILLKKLVPDLQAVEQTLVDERDSMSEEQILEQMKTMIAASPTLANQLRELLGPPRVVSNVKESAS